MPPFDSAFHNQTIKVALLYYIAIREVITDKSIFTTRHF